MRKYRSAYLKPYIRVTKPSDLDGAKANDLSVAIMMGIIESEGCKSYVLVQRGAKGIIAIARSRKELKDRIALVGLGISTFKEWANLIKKQCRR